LAGSWVVSSTTIGGVADPQLVGRTATFVDGRLTFRSKDGDEHSGTYTQDAKASPADIDFVPADGPHKGKLLKGVFAVDGDELTICLGKEREARPTTFSKKTGEQSVLLRMRRTKDQ
jgi:uncharacterized protein (TIGR03067 family)